MGKSVIVGGGCAGLLLGKALLELGHEFLGITRAGELGNDVWPHRFYRNNSWDFLREILPGIAWKRTDEPPAEWRKGRWVEVDRSWLPREHRFFLGGAFFHPIGGYCDFLKQVALSLDGLFLRGKGVFALDLPSRKLVFEGGTELEFERLFWCDPIEPLLKALGTINVTNFKSKKPVRKEGGLIVVLGFMEPVFGRRNTMVFPFRFKDKVVRAFGIVEAETKFHYTWTLLLEGELLECREELAKCVRTFKRELLRQFQIAAEGILYEKIVYLPSLVGPCIEAQGPQLFKDIFYVGPQLRPADCDPEILDLDLIIENCLRASKELSSERLDKITASSLQSQPTL